VPAAKSPSNAFFTTALDAHVRHYAITVLRDVVIALDRERGEDALRMMTRNVSAWSSQRDPLSQVGAHRLG
jgi:nicotinamidase-related amidase